MIMLTSGDFSGSSDRARSAGNVGAYLTKPVRQSELFDVMVNILEDHRIPEPEMTAIPLDAASAGPDATSRPLRVLLAEDHVVNQKVALAMLNGIGHKTTIVSDGRKAVETWRTGDFDLILMDLQMPEMDGFEAVASIRSLEAPTGARVPIIALTAHAMTGDRERCLDAGFDDYLTKPVRSIELRETLEKWAGRIGAGPVAASPLEFDRDSALATLGGDQELLVEIVGLFLDDCPRLLSEIEQAIELQDAPTLKRLAHTVRGVASNFALPAVIEAAAVLESKAKGHAWETIQETYDDLREGLDRVWPVLEAVVATSH